LLDRNKHIEKQLVSRCLENDKLAQKELVDYYGPYIYGYISNYLNNKENAKDVLQETFIAVFKSLESFRSESGLYAWIKTIAQNKCYHYIKTKWHTSVYNYEHTIAIEAQDDFNILSELNEKEILNIIDTLDPANKVVFLMHVVDGLKHSDIAKEIGITEEASRSRLFKAKKALQQKLIHFNL
jgi:RNA polymerase sigma factor (sigma-70 family)